MSENSRANATFKNYAISLGVVVGIILVMAFVVSTRSGENIPTVDYRPDIEVMRQSADYEVTAPSEDMPEGWIPTSSHLDATGPVSWSIGFATPQDSHAMLTQSDGDPDEVIADHVKDAESVGSVMVADQEWEQFEADDWGALVQRGDDRTLIISGSTSMDEFAVLAEHMETHPVPEKDDEASEKDDEASEKDDEASEKDDEASEEETEPEGS